MDREQLNELIKAINNLDHRLKVIENQVGVQAPRPASSVETTPPPLPRQEKTEVKSGNLLGIIGVGCLIVAMILLIKFSIDSGWLTPVRQLILAGLFGGSLIAAPFIFQSKEKDYLSLLPAGGVVILHLTVYGGVYLHKLIESLAATGMIWAIGLLSLWLLTLFMDDVYAILAIAGTYTGAFLVKDSFTSLLPVATHMIIWDAIFVGYAIKLQKRSIITITAYFALGLVCFFGFSAESLSHGMAGELAVIQFIHMLIIMAGTAVYSVRHHPLTEDEVGQLLPVFVFFYGIEYYYLNKIDPNFASAFSLFFSVLLLGSYLFAKKKVKNTTEITSDSIIGLAVMMFFHSIFFVELDDLGKIIFGFVVLIIFSLFSTRMLKAPFKSTSVMCGMIIFYSMVLVLQSDELSKNLGIFFAILYGVTLFTGYTTSKVSFSLIVAHVMMIVGLLRIGTLIGEIWSGPLCALYAFLLLIFSVKTHDKFMASTSLPVVLFAIARFMIFNFGELSQGERIISLIAMGVVIYASGFVYRKVGRYE